MGKRKEISGQKFNMWNVLECAGKNKSGGYLWKCQCDCGTIRVVEGRSVRTGTSKGCGCARKKGHSKNGIQTRKSERLHSVWTSMKNRCFNPNDRYFQIYGGRGITVCDAWLTYDGFREWALNSGYDSNAEYRKCTLDRIDNDKIYCPDNCRWVDQRTQDNNRSSNHILTSSDGTSRTISEWARLSGIRKDTIRRRVVNLGWDVDRAISEKTHRGRTTQ